MTEKYLIVRIADDLTPQAVTALARVRRAIHNAGADVSDIVLDPEKTHTISGEPSRRDALSVSLILARHLGAARARARGRYLAMSPSERMSRDTLSERQRARRSGETPIQFGPISVWVALGGSDGTIKERVLHGEVLPGGTVNVNDALERASKFLLDLRQRLDGELHENQLAWVYRGCDIYRTEASALESLTRNA